MKDQQQTLAHAVVAALTSCDACKEAGCISCHGASKPSFISPEKHD